MNIKEKLKLEQRIMNNRDSIIQLPPPTGE